MGITSLNIHTSKILCSKCIWFSIAFVSEWPHLHEENLLFGQLIPLFRKIDFPDLLINYTWHWWAVLCDSSPVFFHFDSDSDSDSCSSGPSHARVQAVAAVPCCAVYSDIRYILLFVFMFWKINKCWICGLLDSWLGLADSDSDSDSDVMTRTRIWQPGLGHSTVRERPINLSGRYARAVCGPWLTGQGL